MFIVAPVSVIVCLAILAGLAVFTWPVWVAVGTFWLASRGLTWKYPALKDKGFTYTAMGDYGCDYERSSKQDDAEMAITFVVIACVLCAFFIWPLNKLLWGLVFG